MVIFMSIDKFIWAPAGVRTCSCIAFRIYTSREEMIAVENPSGPLRLVF